MDDVNESSDPAVSAIERARVLFERAAPRLRELEAAVESGVLRDTGELIAQRAVELVQLADAAIADATAIEGQVVEVEVDVEVVTETFTAQPPAARSARRSSTLPWLLLAGAGFIVVALVARRQRR